MMMREETLSSSHPPASPGHHRRSCDHCSPDTGDNIVLRPESDHGHHMRHGTLEDSPEASSPPLHAAMVSGQCLHSPVNIFDSQKSNKIKKLFKDISNFSFENTYFINICLQNLPSTRTPGTDEPISDHWSIVDQELSDDHT